MKKILISIVAVAFVALMITNAYSQCTPPTTIPTPPCSCGPPGFTPGFWKHDIAVYLGLDKGGKGSYNAFEGGPLDGVKLTDAMMEGFLAEINADAGLKLDFPTAYAILQLPGWDARRTNLANWFNYEAGYGPY